MAQRSFSSQEDGAAATPSLIWKSRVRLRTSPPGAQIRFVSYGTGSDTFEKHGVRHISLGLPDDNPTNETIVLAGRLIGWLAPDIVVSHEEFSALPVAKIFSKPTVLITDWFTAPEKYSMTTLPFADRIVFLDEAGYFEEPAAAEGRVQYVGPIVREFRYSRSDGARARAELGIRMSSFVITVLPGSWSEKEAPIRDLVLDTFDTISDDSKLLIWIAGKDYEELRTHTAARPNVMIRDFDQAIDRIMVASDCAITKGTRKTHHELSSLGVPSISLHHGRNAIDQARASRFEGNEALSGDVTRDELAAAIHRARSRSFQPQKNGASASACARAILDLLT